MHTGCSCVVVLVVVVLVVVVVCVCARVIRMHINVRFGLRGAGASLNPKP